MKLLSAYIVWQVVKQFYLHKIVHFREVLKIQQEKLEFLVGFSETVSSFV